MLPCMSSQTHCPVDQYKRSLARERRAAMKFMQRLFPVNDRTNEFLKLLLKVYSEMGKIIILC